jgi:type IV secretory pathway protease TraF
VVNTLLAFRWFRGYSVRTAKQRHSELPVSLYLAIHKQPATGDLVFVSVPLVPILVMAKERGYLNVAYSPVRRMKRMVAGAGRPLQPCVLTDHILGPDEVLFMSDYNPISFDCRYFGPLQSATIESVVTHH